ncbi:MAG: response regulator [Elusimicrobiota bacterium]|nr:response regulator [Elusimicrobiota bacterium]
MEPIKRKILSVEDDPDIQQLLHDVLSDETTVLLSAPTLKEAYKLLETHRPDLILLDRELPDGDSVELCVKVRNDPRLRSVPILMLTGRGAVTDKVLGLNVGADDYLTKPFAVEELKARIGVLLRRASANDLAKQVRNNILRRPT